MVGHASFRDLLTRTKGSLVAERMTTPVEVVSRGTKIDAAARQMVQLGLAHRLIVTEETPAVGSVSALDAMAALLGLPVVHAPTFPRFDRAMRISWKDEAELTFDAISVAPDGPGVFVLIQGAPLKPDWIIWTESTLNVRTRLSHLLCVPQKDALLAQLLEGAGNLRFRAAAVAKEGDRRRALEKIKDVAERWPASAFNCETEHGVAAHPSHADRDGM